MTVVQTTLAASSDIALADAVAGLGSRYRFVATITVGGSETTRVEGLITDGTGHYVVTVGTEQVEYLVGSTGQWLRPAGGSWTALSTAAPVGDPLAPLTSPTSIELVSEQGGALVLQASYPASELGFTTGGDVLVTISVVDGILTEVRYVATVGGAEAEVVTVFTPDPEATTVTVPAG